jgi:hypothetical protein
MVIKEPKRLSSKHRRSLSPQHLFSGSWDASRVIRSAVCTAKSEGDFGQLDGCRHTQPSGKPPAETDSYDCGEGDRRTAGMRERSIAICRHRE